MGAPLVGKTMLPSAKVADVARQVQNLIDTVVFDPQSVVVIECEGEPYAEVEGRLLKHLSKARSELLRVMMWYSSRNA